MNDAQARGRQQVRPVSSIERDFTRAYSLITKVFRPHELEEFPALENAVRVFHRLDFGLSRNSDDLRGIDENYEGLVRTPLPSEIKPKNSLRARMSIEFIPTGMIRRAPMPVTTSVRHREPTAAGQARLLRGPVTGRAGGRLPDQSR